MLNKTIIQSTSKEYIPYSKTVNVTEKRAPTDESVRLLRDMEEAAKRNIIKRISVDTTYIKCECIVYGHEMDMSIEYYLKYNINNNEKISKINIPENELRKLNNPFNNVEFERLLYTKLAEFLAKEIAANIIMEGLNAR